MSTHSCLNVFAWWYKYQSQKSKELYFKTKQRYFADLKVFGIATTHASPSDQFDVYVRLQSSPKFRAGQLHGDYYSLSWLIFITKIRIETALPENRRNFYEAAWHTY